MGSRQKAKPDHRLKGGGRTEEYQWEPVDPGTRFWFAFSPHCQGKVTDDFKGQPLPREE